jgi:hypothetical protein
MDRLLALNFRKASLTRVENDEILADLNADLRDVMERGNGVNALNARQDLIRYAGQLLRQAVDNEVSYTDPIPLMFQTRTAGLGDVIEFDSLINTLRVVEYSPHSHPLTYTPVKNKYTISTKMYEMAFGIPMLEIMSGRKNVGDYAKFAAQALQRHRLELGLTAIYTAVSSGATDPAGRALYDTVTDDEVDEDTLKAGIRRLGSVSGGTVRVFGTKWALDPIMDFIGENSENLAEELNARGVLGTYRGATLVAINHSHDQYTNSFVQVAGIPLDNLLFLVADMPGGIYMERDISALDYEQLDPRTGTFQTGTRLDHGVLITEGWKYHVIEMGVES